MDSIIRYKKIATNLVETNSVKVKASIPSPTDKDYNRGYIIRYFVRKVNDNNSVIYEVSQTEFSSIISNSFYIGSKIKWRISGSIEEVRNSNNISVKLGSEKISNLKLYLPNLLQFHK
jgi:hypothetical protein